MMRLQELLDAIDIKANSVDRDVAILGIAYHSQKVKQGDLFVCIRGYKTDGHKYIPQAIANGAVAIIVEETQEGIVVPQYRVSNGRLALAQLAAKFYGYPSKQLKAIGITATNGKTTSSFMTNAILEQHGYKTGLIGTVSVKIDDSSVPSVLTTPESLDMQHYLREMVERNVSHVTMEVSSAALELHRVHAVEYNIVTLNNINREHIDHHGTFEKYYDAKAGLIRNARATSVAVLNLDDPYSAALRSETAAQVITYSLNNLDADIVCRDLDLSTGRAVLTISVPQAIQIHDRVIAPTQFEIALKVPGLHSVYNALVAVTIALVYEVPISTIQVALQQFAGVERRFEYIFEDKFKIIDDHFANAGNIDVTLGTLKYMQYNHLHLVYAIRGMRGPTVNRENAEAIAHWAKQLGFRHVIATKSKYHVTEKDAVTDEEERVFREVMANAAIGVTVYEELPQAISSALAEAKDRDLILLAGCQGMDYGAEVALQLIAELRPDISRERLFAPLQHRVAGVTRV